MNLICGVNPVLEALSSGSRHFDRLLVAKGLRNRRISEAISRASRLAIPLRFETRETLDRMAGGVPHQGLIAVVSPRPVSTLDELLSTAREPALFVVLDGVEDPRNLGAILRTAEAAGVDGVLLPDRHNAGLSETVNRASAGALEHVRLARIGNVAQALTALKERGVWVVGMDASGRERWDAIDYRRPIALVLGGEGRGMRRLVRENCDHVCSLPLFGHVASLNVSVAAGAGLYEIIRQRGTVPSHVRPIPARAPAPSQVVGPSADDDEHDPGALRQRSSVPVDEDDEEGAENGEVHVVLNDEDVAWAGPTVIKHTGFRRGHPRSVGRHKGGDKRRHRGDQKRDPAQDAPRNRTHSGEAARGGGGARRSTPPLDGRSEAPAPRERQPETLLPTAEGREAQPPNGDRTGRGRRRRRRRGVGGVPAQGQGGPRTDGGGNVPPGGPGDQGQGAGSPTSQNGPPSGGEARNRGRRRHRRRRRETPK